MISPVRRLIRGSALMLMLSAAAPCAQAGQELFVVYPETGEPFRTVFEQIVQGIESQAPVRRFVARDGGDPGELTRLLAERRPAAVVALGQRSVMTMNALDVRPPVVAGAVLSLPEPNAAGAARLAGISLAPDPALLFARLRVLAPGVRQVTVVYSPAQNEWLIALAREAAKNHGLELSAHPVASLREAAIRYRDVFARARGANHAVWLPLDSIAAEEGTIVPLVLEQAWNRDVVLFASSLGHVQRGALFCLYPDNQRLGQRLAAMASEPNAAGLVPLRDARLAVNLRTASHLGLDISGQRRSFDLVFPSP